MACSNCLSRRDFHPRSNLHSIRSNWRYCIDTIFVLGRSDARAKRRQDRRYTVFYENYLNIRIARDDLKNGEAVQHMNHAGGERKREPPTYNCNHTDYI